MKSNAIAEKKSNAERIADLTQFLFHFGCFLLPRSQIASAVYADAHFIIIARQT